MPDAYGIGSGERAGASSPDAVRMSFTGSAREYFGIWIVNLCLSIFTLGIYSAWAKVRTRRFFLGHTGIGGRTFDYHATGLQILVGRLIVIALLIAWSVASRMLPVVAAFGIVFIFVMPWLINRSLRFNAAMTSWSNVRFRFEGQYWRAFLVFLLYPFLCIFTLYLAYPYAARAGFRYRIGRHRIGDHGFAFDGGVGPFYAAFAMAILWVAAISVAAIVILAGALQISPGSLADLGRGAPSGDVSPLPVFLAFLLFVLAIVPASTIYTAYVRRAVYDGMTLEGGHRFESRASAGRIVMIAISNAFAVALSAGLLLPWAQVRMARYLVTHTWVIPAGSLDAFHSRAEARQTAVGDAYTDIEGFDVGPAI